MVDLGTDISTYPDLDPLFAPISGSRVLAEALLRRFQTPRGGLFYDPDYGTDLRAWLNDSFDANAEGMARLAAAVEAEANKDERVGRATASVSLDLSTNRMTITLRVEPREGVAFRLVLDVSQVSVALINIAQA